MAKKILIVMMTAIILLGMMVMPVKEFVLGSQTSVEILAPVDNQLIPINEDLTIKILITDSRETSYQWGYSFVSSAAITLTNSKSSWSYKSPLMWFTIPAKAIQQAVDMFGSFIHLYIYEVDKYGYATGFYKKIDLIVYRAKGELNEISYSGEADLLNIFLHSNVSGYIHNVKETGAWKKEVNYCCNPPITQVRYYYKASASVLIPGTIEIKFWAESIPATSKIIIRWPYIYWLP